MHETRHSGQYSFYKNYKKFVEYLAALTHMTHGSENDNYDQCVRIYAGSLTAINEEVKVHQRRQTSQWTVCK